MARRYDADDAFDERGVLKDGHSIRVPMMMMDSADDGLTDLQRSVRDDAAPMRVVDAFGADGLALSRPGSRYLAGGRLSADGIRLTVAEVVRREARDEYLRELQDAWKGASDHREVERVHDTGDPVRDAWLDSVEDLTTAWMRR